METKGGLQSASSQGLGFIHPGFILSPSNLICHSMISKRQSTAMWCGGTEIRAASNLLIEAKPEPRVLKVRYFFWRCGFRARLVVCQAALQFSADIRLIRERTFSDHQFADEPRGGRIASNLCRPYNAVPRLRAVFLFGDVWGSSHQPRLDGC
jgi:hypothetical protein